MLDEHLDRSKVTTTMLFDTTAQRNGLLGSGMQTGVVETYLRIDELPARLASSGSS